MDGADKSLLEMRVASESLKWSRRILGLVLSTTLILISLFTILYMRSGNTGYLIAIIVLAATIPLDIALIIGLIRSNAHKITEYATKMLRSINHRGGAVKGLPCGVLLALKVQGGHIHAIICISRVEVAKVALPVVNPVGSIIRFPRLGRQPILKLSLTRCKRGFEEGAWSIISIDPDKGTKAKIYGSVRYSYKICNRPIETTDIEEVMDMVLS